MKKLKNILYIALFSLLAVSCEDNTDSITNPGALSPLPQEVKVSFTDDNATSSPYEGETMTYRLEMPFAITGTVDVTLAVTSSDGTVEADYPTSITFVDGQSAVYFDVTPADDGVSEDEIYTIAITGVSFSNDNYFAWTGESLRTIEVKDMPHPSEGPVEITLNWTDTSRDMDLYLIEGNQVLGGTLLDYSFYDFPESVTLSDGTPDATYSIYIDQYVFTVPVDFTMTFDYPEPALASEVFTGTVSSSGFVFTFTKTTSINGVVSYSVTQL